MPKELASEGAARFATLRQDRCSMSLLGLPVVAAVWILSFLHAAADLCGLFCSQQCSRLRSPLATRRSRQKYSPFVFMDVPCMMYEMLFVSNGLINVLYPVFIFRVTYFFLRFHSTFYRTARNDLIVFIAELFGLPSTSGMKYMLRKFPVVRVHFSVCSSYIVR